MSAPMGLPSGGLLSLWDIMIGFDGRLLLTRLNPLERFENELLRIMPTPPHPGGLRMLDGESPDALFTPYGRQWIWAHLGPFQDELKPLDLIATPIEVQHIWNHAHV